MSTVTYERRKAQGMCPWCTMLAAPGHVYCAGCRAIMAERHQRHRTSQSPVPTANELACCNAWHPVTTIPLTVPCCGRVYLEAV